jgi:hypothetical protein
MSGCWCGCLAAGFETDFERDLDGVFGLTASLEGLYDWFQLNDLVNLDDLTDFNPFDALAGLEALADLEGDLEFRDPLDVKVGFNRRIYHLW